MRERHSEGGGWGGLGAEGSRQAESNWHTWVRGELIACSAASRTARAASWAAFSVAMATIRPRTIATSSASGPAVASSVASVACAEAIRSVTDGIPESEGGVAGVAADGPSAGQAVGAGPALLELGNDSSS